MESIQSSDGTAIAFDRSGDGPPVIFVPGLFQHRAIDPGTAELAALLAPRFTVFHYDRRGRGDSGDTAPYAVEREVEDVGALIDEAGGSAALYGMSSGGALALEAAARGLAVTKLAVYEPPFMDDDGNIEPSEELAAGVAEHVEAGRPGDAVALFMTSSGVPAEAVEQMRQAPFWAGLESVAHTMPYDLALMGDTTLLSERAPTVAVPTLVLDGGASEPWGRRSADAVAAAVPGAERRDPRGPDPRGRRRAARPRAGRVLRPGLALGPGHLDGVLGRRVAGDDVLGRLGVREVLEDVRLARRHVDHVAGAELGPSARGGRPSAPRARRRACRRRSRSSRGSGAASARRAARGRRPCRCWSRRWWPARSRRRRPRRAGRRGRRPRA